MAKKGKKKLKTKPSSELTIAPKGIDLIKVEEIVLEVSSGVKKKLYTSAYRDEKELGYEEWVNYCLQSGQAGLGKAVLDIEALKTGNGPLINTKEKTQLQEQQDPLFLEIMEVLSEQYEIEEKLVSMGCTDDSFMINKNVRNIYKNLFIMADIKREEALFQKMLEKEGLQEQDINQEMLKNMWHVRSIKSEQLQKKMDEMRLSFFRSLLSEQLQKNLDFVDKIYVRELIPLIEETIARVKGTVTLETKLAAVQTLLEVTAIYLKVCTYNLLHQALDISTAECGERAYIGFHFLSQHPYIKENNIRVELVCIAVGEDNHAFVLINRPSSSDLQSYQTWGKNCIYVDLYSATYNGACIASAIPEDTALVWASQNAVDFQLEALGDTHVVAEMRKNALKIFPSARDLFTRMWSEIESLQSLEDLEKFRGEPMPFSREKLSELAKTKETYKGMSLYEIDKRIVALHKAIEAKKVAPTKSLEQGSSSSSMPAISQALHDRFKQSNHQGFSSKSLVEITTAMENLQSDVSSILSTLKL